MLNYPTTAQLSSQFQSYWFTTMNYQNLYVHVYTYMLKGYCVTLTVLR